MNDKINSLKKWHKNNKESITKLKSKMMLKKSQAVTVVTVTGTALENLCVCHIVWKKHGSTSGQLSFFINNDV